MDKYLNKGVKDVIREFPQVGTILEDFGVGCVTCSVGTCLLKDIIDIHSLPKDVQRVMMAKIEKTIYPDRDIVIEELPEKVGKSVDKELPKEIKYSAPMKELVEEHDNIKLLLGNISKICSRMIKTNTIDRELILKCVEFIKSYADSFHHSKEEDILFKYADENSDIIKAMLEDHDTARGYVRGVLQGVEEEDIFMVVENLTSYGKLLKEHIKKEDEILYPFIDRGLSEEKINSLAEEFGKVNTATGEEFKRKWTDFLSSI